MTDACSAPAGYSQAAWEHRAHPRRLRGPTNPERLGVRGPTYPERLGVSSRPAVRALCLRCLPVVPVSRRCLSCRSRRCLPGLSQTDFARLFGSAACRSVAMPWQRRLLAPLRGNVCRKCVRSQIFRLVARGVAACVAETLAHGALPRRHAQVCKHERVRTSGNKGERARVRESGRQAGRQGGREPPCRAPGKLCRVPCLRSLTPTSWGTSNRFGMPGRRALNSSCAAHPARVRTHARTHARTRRRRSAGARAHNSCARVVRWVPAA